MQTPLGNVNDLLATFIDQIGKSIGFGLGSLGLGDSLKGAADRLHDRGLGKPPTVNPSTGFVVSSAPAVTINVEGFTTGAQFEQQVAGAVRDYNRRNGLQ
jgi:hypothetical protein